MMIRLAIWAGESRIGTLSHDAATNLFDFIYAESWIQQQGSFPLSPQMPMFRAANAVQVGAFGDLAPEQRSSITRAFFQNLLPEGQALDVAAQVNGVSKGNLAGLLVALGAETAGALRVTLADATPAEQANNAGMQLRPLPLTELSERIRYRTELPFSVWDGKVRLSIAGLQDKIAVFEDQGELFLANGVGTASTVIVKPAPADPRFADLPLVEHVCMRLASMVGIAAASTTVLDIPEPVLLVERFDRRRTGDGVERVHIVDACQALGLAPELKYERAYGDQQAVQHLRDGASMAQLFSIADNSPAPLAIPRIRKWVQPIQCLRVPNTCSMVRLRKQARHELQRRQPVRRLAEQPAVLRGGAAVEAEAPTSHSMETLGTLDSSSTCGHHLIASRSPAISWVAGSGERLRRESRASGDVAPRSV
jgi:serine/threonine-protein kinase HipA